MRRFGLLLIVVVIMSLALPIIYPTSTSSIENGYRYAPSQEENVTLEWSKIISTSSEDMAYRIAGVKENDTEYIYTVCESSNAIKKFIIVKMASDGNVSWNITREVYGVIRAYNLMAYQDGNIYMAGSVLQKNITILRIYKNGSYETIFNSPLSYSNISELSLQFRGGFQFTEDGMYIAVTSFNLISSQSSSDIAVFKIAENGTILWSLAWGGNDSDQMVDIAVGIDGNIYVVGNTESFGETSDIFLLGIMPNGTLLFNVTWSTPNNEYANDMFVDQHGYIYITGYTCPQEETASDVLLLKYYRNVLQYNVTWDSGGDDYGNGIYVSSSHIYIVGYFKSDYTAQEDILILRSDLSGNVLWTGSWSNNDTDIGYGIYVTENEDIYVCGSTKTASYGDDIVILKYRIPSAIATISTVEQKVLILDVATFALLFALVPIIIVCVLYKKMSK